MKPTFEVVASTGHPAERRLVTAARVRRMIASPEADDALLEDIIDGVSADCVRYCNLDRARDALPTFGRETLRATWLKTGCDRGATLVLPWRAPIVSVTVEEAGVELAESACRLLGGGLLQRLSDGAAGCWSGEAIVVTYVAGWDLDPEDPSYDEDHGEGVPADLAARVVDQVGMAYRSRKINPLLRSENLDGVWSGSYNVPGGDAIGKSGLLRPLEEALAPYRRLVVG